MTTEADCFRSLLLRLCRFRSFYTIVKTDFYKCLDSSLRLSRYCLTIVKNFGQIQWVMLEGGANRLRFLGRQSKARNGRRWRSR